MLLSGRMKNILEDKDIIVPEGNAFSPQGSPCLVNLHFLFLEGSFNQDILIRSISWWSELEIFRDWHLFSSNLDSSQKSPTCLMASANSVSIWKN